jgi:hypothetical protein
MKINRLLLLSLTLMICVTVSDGQNNSQKNSLTPHLSPLAVDAAKRALTTLRQKIADQHQNTDTRKEGKDCLDLSVVLDEVEAYLPKGELKTEIQFAAFDYRFALDTSEMMPRYEGKTDDPEVAELLKHRINSALKFYPPLKEKIKNSDDLMDQMAAAWAAALNAATEHVKAASALLLEQQ